VPRVPAPLAAAASAAVATCLTERLRRRRTRQVIADARARIAAALASVPTAEQAREDAAVALLLDRPEPGWLEGATPVTDGVHARLQPGDAAAVLERMESFEAELHASAEEPARRRLVLNFAAAYGVAPVLERSGLLGAMPPEDVHAMARGSVAAGGDFFTADLIFDALEHAGMAVGEGATLLDFGASSGRVLRAIAAGRPDLECLGCDPNAGTIAWAAEHLPMARFFVSPQRPPLALADASVQIAVAVSIWSHFAEEPAVAWLAELHRVLAPGGALVLTTQAFDSLSTLLRRGHVSPGTATAAAAAMVEGRHHFVDVFGPEGDWGVKDAGWGDAYFTLEWLLGRTGDDWAVRLNWPGALDQAQDVVVLERR